MEYDSKIPGEERGDITVSRESFYLLESNSRYGLYLQRATRASLVANNGQTEWVLLSEREGVYARRSR